MRFNNEFPSSGYNPKSLPATAFAKKTERAKKAYIRWLNKNHPDLLNRALRQLKMSRSEAGLNGFGLGQTDTEEKAWYDKLLDQLPSLASGYAAIKQQEELIKINRERAQQGLPPLNSAPSIQVEAGAETRETMRQSIKEAAGQYMPLIALGIGGVLLLTTMRPKRKRR